MNNVMEWLFEHISTFHDATVEQKTALGKLVIMARAYEKQLTEKGQHESGKPVGSTEPSEDVTRGQ